MTDEIVAVDMLAIMKKPLEEMSDEELLYTLDVIREKRKIKISVKRSKSSLDLILAKLDPKVARVLLEKLGGKEEGKEKEKEKD